MARRGGTRRNRNGGQKAVTNVRMVPDGEGNRAERVNRMITAVKEQQGQVRVVVKAIYNIGFTGTGGVTVLDFAVLRAQADFVSLATQYRTSKVSGIRFDVYDINPNAMAISVVLGTYHGRTAGDAPTSQANVTDLSDSRLVAPGTGLYTWYWYPTGPAENSWYSNTDAVNNFGGLAIYTPSAAVAPKFEVIISYVVDFRARY